MAKSQNELVKVKFDGQDHQVDIDTFTQVLLNYSTVIQAAASEAGTQGNIKVAICAIESGSLDVLVSIASSGLGGLFDFIVDNKETIGTVVALAGGLYQFKKDLAGKGKIVETEEVGGDQIVAVTEKGDVTVNKPVYNIYVNHPEATDAIDSTFSRLEEFPEIEGLEFSVKGRTEFRAEHDEFSAIAESYNHEPDNVSHIIEDNAVLTVIKPFLGPSRTRKWEFYYKGGKISAVIVDEAFLGRIAEYSFTVGTKMIVDLDIERIYRADIDVDLNKSYKIIAVHDVEQPPRPNPLF